MYSADRLAFQADNPCNLLTGSRSKLDAGSLMSMQEDARSRRISSEVMKHRLYESVVTSPRRRRMSLNYGAMDDSAQGFSKAFMIQSLPVTPAHSQYGSPETSPTEQRRFLFGYFSRGTTPLVRTPSEEDMCIDSNDIPEEDSWKGLASMFNPQPRCIPAVNSGRHSYVCSIDEEMASNGAAKGSGMGGGMAGDSLVLEAPPRASKKRTRSTASIEVDSERRHSPVDSDRRHSPVN